MKSYQEAETRLRLYRTSREALGLGDYPESGPDRRILALKAANANASLGIRVAGPELTKHLDNAIVAYKQLLNEMSSVTNPQDWAMTQNNLGNALGVLASRSEGPRAAELLNQAVKAYRSALQVRTREQLPQDWAMTQYNLGNALDDLASRSEGPRAAELLNQAVEAYRSALKVRTREQLPQHWAMTQNNLGIALGDLATRLEGPRAAELLNQAVEAYRSALKVRTREQLPQDWAMTQNNLGIALQMYFQVSEFRAGLEQLGRLMREKGFPDDPRLVSLVHVLRVMCHNALAEEAQVSEALHALIAHIEQQAEPFHIAWSFSRLRRVVEQSKVATIVTNRKFLLAFLDAASGKSRDEILAALKRLRQQ